MSTNPFADGWDEAKVEAMLARGSPAELLYVPIVVSLDPPDCAWAYEVCLRLASHDDVQVRSNAILSFGHLSRTCSALNEAQVRPLLEAALGDNDARVRANAETAASDIAHFLNWKFPQLG